MAQLNFNAAQVDPNQAFDPVPAGWYTVLITESEMKPTAKGGHYLQLTMDILDGPHKGRKLFDRLNLDNANPVAVEIAQKTLSAICHATNVIQVQDSQQLHGIPMEAKVSVRAATEQYDASNDVKGYRAVGGGVGAGGQQGPAMGQPKMGGAPQTGGAQQAPGQWQQPAQQGGYQQPAQQPQQQWNQAPQQQPAMDQVPPQYAQQQGGWNQQPQQGGPAPGFQQEQAPAQQQGAPAQQQTTAQPQEPHGAQQSQNSEPQPAWGGPQGGQQGMATGHPTQGPAPSAGGAPGTPPWGQPQQ